MTEPIAIRWNDPESSMLTADEAEVASATLHRIIQKYGDEFRRLGRDNIIREFRQYLLHKLEATEENFRELMRYQGEETQDPLYPYRTALRALESAFVSPQAGYRNYLARDAEEFRYQLDEELGISVKDLTAYYWLAASDENMDLSSETPREGVSSNSSKEETIESSKTEFTAKIAEVFRAHSGEHGLPIEIDSPSCPVGTIGRLFYSAIYNPVATMIRINPEREFPDKIRAFMLTKFRRLSSRNKLNALGYITNIAVECDQVTPEETESMQIFLATLNPDEFVAQLVEEYGRRAMNERRCTMAAQMLTAHTKIDTFFNDDSPFLKMDGYAALERIKNETVIKADSPTGFLLARSRDPNTHADDLLAIIGHANVSSACINTILSRSNAALLKAIAEANSTDATTLLAISQHPNANPATLLAVAQHKETNPKTLHIILRNPYVDAATLLAVAQHPNANSATLYDIVFNHHVDAATLLAVALHKMADAETLFTIAQRTKDSFVINQHANATLLAVAQHPNANAATLLAITQYPPYVNAETLLAVVMHKNTDTEILFSIAQHLNANAEVLQKVAQHPNVDAKVLRKVARRDMTNTETLWSIAQAQRLDANTETLLAIAQHSNTNTETLATVARHSADTAILASIALHPNVNAAVLAIIQDHANEILKQALLIKSPTLKNKILYSLSSFPTMIDDRSPLAWEDTFSRFSTSIFKSKESYILHWLERYLEKEPLDIEHVTRYSNALSLRLTEEEIKKIVSEYRDKVSAVADPTPSTDPAGRAPSMRPEG